MNTVYAMGALAGVSQANAHYMEPHKEEVARRAISCASAKEYSCAVCAWIEFVKKIVHYDLRSRHACSLPGAVVQLLSQSPHLHAQGELDPLSKAPLYPSISPLRFAPLARVILDAVSNF
jgi:hypothetical protein